VRPGPELREFGRARFLAELDGLLAVYGAAMRPPPEQVPGRRAIMERHTQFPSFRCVAVTLPAGAAGGTGSGAGTAGPAPCAVTGARAAVLAGFAYGFHGAAGQWWHDLVRGTLASTGGDVFAQDWLADSFEVAEVHVHPDYQGRGLGRWLVPALAHPRLERTALLSTQDAESRARRLYRSLGFTDLITRYRFPGTDPPYAVMGAVLPLRPGRAPAWPGPQHS
jgi:GNAT superfamily N-acetyltransferase